MQESVKGAKYIPPVTYRRNVEKMQSTLYSKINELIVNPPNVKYIRKIEKSPVVMSDFYRNATNLYERNVAQDIFYKERKKHNFSMYASTLRDKLC